MVDERSLARLRWRCRRGLLENDLILARFLDARGDSITESEVAALDKLLDLGDNDLWDLLSGRREPADETVAPLIQRMRSV
jgi:antitoxin CptB